MSSVPRIHKFGQQQQDETQLPQRDPKVVTDLAIPGRDGTDVQRFMSGQMDRGEACNIVDDIETLSATHDPAVAIQGVLGMPVEAAIYVFNAGGQTVSGISAAGARALAAYRGGFTIRVVSCEPSTKRVQIKADNGEHEIHEVPSWMANVEVVDTTNGNVFPAVYNQAEVLSLKNGGWRLNEHALQIAISKATRNAILYHFAGVEATVQKFVEAAKARGDVLILGHVSQELDEASDAREQARKHHQLRRAEPLGKTEAGMFRGELERAVAEASASGGDASKLTGDCAAFLARAYGAGVTAADIPATDKRRLYEWLNEKRLSLGLTPLPGFEFDAAVAPDTPALPEHDEKTGEVRDEQPAPEPTIKRSPIPKGRAAAEAAAAEAAPENSDLFADQ